MQHAFVNSDKTKFDSNCSVCDGKQRDAVHTLEPLAQHIARNGEILWLYSMGKRFQIRAIFTDDESSNEYMRKHDEIALIAEFGPFRIVANKYEGIREPANAR